MYIYMVYKGFVRIFLWPIFSEANYYTPVDSATSIISIVIVRNGDMCYVGVSDILVVMY